MSAITKCCACPDPELCRRLKRHIIGRLWDIWRGIDVEANVAEGYRQRWLAEAAADPGQITPIPIRPKCPHLWKRVRHADGAVKRVRVADG